MIGAFVRDVFDIFLICVFDIKTTKSTNYSSPRDEKISILVLEYDWFMEWIFPA